MHLIVFLIQYRNHKCMYNKYELASFIIIIMSSIINVLSDTFKKNIFVQSDWHGTIRDIYITELIQKRGHSHSFSLVHAQRNSEIHPPSLRSFLLYYLLCFISIWVLKVFYWNISVNLWLFFIFYRYFF